MRAVVQRVRRASVTVNGEVTGEIGPGLLILLGVHETDTEDEIDWGARKCARLRIFADDEGLMNRSLQDVSGEALVVSQFTLYGDCRRGRRPSFSDAAPAERARLLYEHFVSRARTQVASVATGRFQAHMALALVNDGPVTLILDSAESD